MLPSILHWKNWDDLHFGTFAALPACPVSALLPVWFWGLASTLPVVLSAPVLLLYAHSSSCFQGYSRSCHSYSRFVYSYSRFFQAVSRLWGHCFPSNLSGKRSISQCLFHFRHSHVQLFPLWGVHSRSRACFSRFGANLHAILGIPTGLLGCDVWIDSVRNKLELNSPSIQLHPCAQLTTRRPAKQKLPQGILQGVSGVATVIPSGRNWNQSGQTGSSLS